MGVVNSNGFADVACDSREAAHNQRRCRPSCSEVDDMRKREIWTILLAAALVAVTGTTRAGEAAKKAETPKAPEAGKAEKAAEPRKEPTADEGDKDDVVAKVDDTKIKRSELIEERRQLALRDRRAPLPNNEVILDRLINRVLLQRYFDKEKLAPTGAEVQAAIQRLDTELRRRRTSYQRFLADRGITAEAHAALLRYEMSMRRLVKRMADGIAEEQVRAEYDANPEFYDGSRVRLSQIFVDTSNISHDPKKIEEAKQKIDKCYADLKAGKEFKHVASDHSDDAASAGRDGDRGWFRRKGSQADEELMAAAWKLKVGEFAEPIRGSRGWHILKVTEREPAHFTYFGCKRRIKQELTRQQLDTILKDLKDKAKIEKSL
jgi:parvulin-like peptidyl-prolyl isomerase